MTNKEYLNQAYRLNERINSDLKELDELRALAANIGSPSIGERVSGSHSTEAPFARAVIRIDELERKLNEEIDRFIGLKSEISDAIRSVPNPDEEILLRYRYINCYGWNKICALMSVSTRTVHRIHASALKNFLIPS